MLTLGTEEDVMGRTGCRTRKTKWIKHSKQIGAASHSPAVVLMRDFNYPSIYWSDNIAGHKQSRWFLKYVDGNFLLQ